MSDPGNSETTWLKMFHVLILGTCCTKKIRIKINSKDSITEQHAPIYNEGLKLYQASSKRAIIPIGFCKCKYNSKRPNGNKKIEEYLNVNIKENVQIGIRYLLEQNFT